MKYLVFLLLSIILLCSCSRRIYIPTERVVHTSDTVVVSDTVISIIERVRVDTIVSGKVVSTVVVDSIAPVVDSSGKVTGFDRWHYRLSDSRTDNRSVSLASLSDSISSVSSESRKSHDSKSEKSVAVQSARSQIVPVIALFFVIALVVVIDRVIGRFK